MKVVLKRTLHSIIVDKDIQSFRNQKHLYFVSESAVKKVNENPTRIGRGCFIFSILNYIVIFKETFVTIFFKYMVFKPFGLKKANNIFCLFCDTIYRE